MAFDSAAAGRSVQFAELPHHNIQIPGVQFYHPPWQLAQMAVEARQKMYAMMLQGLDSVLGATDPVNIAKRRAAIANANFEIGSLPYKQQELQYNTMMLKAKSDWYSDPANRGKPFPWPATYSEANQALTFNQRSADQARGQAANTDPTKGGNVPPNKIVPSVNTPTVVPTPQKTTYEENVQKFGPLPGNLTDDWWNKNNAQPAAQPALIGPPMETETSDTDTDTGGTSTAGPRDV
jgi:hypothetical protein